MCICATQDKRTALIWAVLMNQTECVRLLVEAGADKDVEDTVRNTSCSVALCNEPYYRRLNFYYQAAAGPNRSLIIFVIY
jgi:hypothetical protein